MVPKISAAPYQPPPSGAQVLEQLPARNDPRQKELANLRSQLQREPANVNLAAALARRYISMARNDADPRYLSYAQAALAPWWEKANPPTEVLVLRATVLQSTHRFTEALADLDQLLKNDRRNGQAWITRATVLQVQGQFEEAKKSCAQLAGVAEELVIAYLPCQCSQPVIVTSRWKSMRNKSTASGISLCATLIL